MSSNKKLGRNYEDTKYPNYDPNKIDDSWRPTCPFCHAKWTDDMMQLETIASGYCETCYSTEPGIKIHCHECKRLIYTKEGSW